MRIVIWHTRLPKTWPMPDRLDPSAPTIHEQWVSPMLTEKPGRWLEKFKMWGDR
jgi:hypothetical protein